jgi:hypothetical protein
MMHSEQDIEDKPPQEALKKRCRSENEDLWSHPHPRNQHITLGATATGIITGNGKPITHRRIAYRGKDTTISRAATDSSRTMTTTPYQIPPNLKNPYKNPKPHSNTHLMVTPQTARATAEENGKSEDYNVTVFNSSKVPTTNEQDSANTTGNPETPNTPPLNKNCEASIDTNETEPGFLEKDQMEQPPYNAIPRLNTKDPSAATPSPTNQLTIHHLYDHETYPNPKAASTAHHTPRHVDNHLHLSDTPASGTHPSWVHQNIQNTRNPYKNQEKNEKSNKDDNFLSTFLTNGRKLHHSPFLDSHSKTPYSSIELHQDMDALGTLILLQHKAFTQHIKDLGEINLTLTKIIEKRKNSYISLQYNNKIPRRIKMHTFYFWSLWKRQRLPSN